MIWLLYLLKALCVCLIAALVLLLGVNVFMRYVLGDPIAWSTECAHFFLIWLSFLGMAVATAERRHMAMTLLSDSLKGKARTLLETLSSFVIILTMAYAVWYGVQLVTFNWALKSEQLQISYAYFYAAVPIGAFAYLLFELRYLISVMTGADDVWTQCDEALH